jgi:hypothetical protein
MPETCAAERGARDTGGRCMVPASCKGVFPKRLTGQRPANRKLDRERQQHDAEWPSVHGGLPKSTLRYSEDSRQIYPRTLARPGV